MAEHAFIPGPRRIRLRKKRRILRSTREVGAIIDRPDFESMTFLQQLLAARLAGSRSSISTQQFREFIGQLSRRHPDATMGISPKYLIHTLDAGSIEDAATEVYGTDTTQSSVWIDPELTMIALEEAFELLAGACTQGANIIFATSRPYSMLPLMIELASLSSQAGANIIDSYSNTSSLVIDGRKERQFTWVSSVAVACEQGSLLAIDDACAADDLFFFLPRPDLVVADHIFAGQALTSGYPTIAFTGLESIAVAVASTNEKSCLTVPISLTQPSSHYSIIANYAKSFFNFL